MATATSPPPSFSPELERIPIARFTEKAYLDYSMYVVLDRALPSVADGLKPVQRRIIYAMSELGLSAAAKFKKSARTVGDVLGKYHPHGDSACYEAMVLMAQSFSFRYPLVDGQGNWGSPDDPKSFAAMRYTEARLTPFAAVLLSELDAGATDWVPNFDGTLDEPRLLPARLPHVLLNGAAGIAVGMATDIPPHNIGELVAATVHLLDHPDASDSELTTFVPAPDFPTPAEIVSSKAELRQMYETGNGSVRQRARYVREGQNIVLYALPYQVSGNRILEQIAAQMTARKLPWVEDLRDEGDHQHPTRIVIELRSNRVDVERLMSHLFATTDLEKTFRVNMNAVGLDGRPRLYTLRTLLAEWLAYRIDTVRRRLEHRLEKVLDRLHVLEGYLVAFLNIDEVIRIIRENDEPKPVLMARFELTDRQAEAILELKLRHIAKLEEMKIRGEQDKLLAERLGLEDTLSSEKKLRALVKKELLADAETFGDERRSPLVELAPSQAAAAFVEADLVATEPLTVVLSEKGWVRAGKGHDLDPTSLTYKAGDAYLDHARGKSSQQAVFLDSTGRSYSLTAHTLPSARSHGEPLSSSLQPPSGALFLNVLLGEPEELVLLATNHGYGFLAQLGDLHSRQRAGKVVVTIPDGASILRPQIVPNVEDSLLMAVTTHGYVLVFPIKDLPQMPRGKGNKIINIPKKRLLEPKNPELLDTLVILPPTASVRVHAGRKQPFEIDPKRRAEFTGQRAQRGTVLSIGYRNFDRLEVVG